MVDAEFKRRERAAAPELVAQDREAHEEEIAFNSAGVDGQGQFTPDPIPEKVARLRTASTMALTGLSQVERTRAFELTYDADADLMADDIGEAIGDAAQALRELNDLFKKIGGHATILPPKQIHGASEIRKEVAEWATQWYGVRITPRMVERCHEEFQNELEESSAE